MCQALAVETGRTALNTQKSLKETGVHRPGEGSQHDPWGFLTGQPSLLGERWSRGQWLRDGSGG